MHVLLINCHNGSDESNKSWKEFEKQVRKCFSHMIEMMHFSVRKLNELAEFFDKVDFIFIDGEKTFKPWAAASKSLVTLIKMSCQVGFKCVFGTTPLMASLCFVIATGGKDVKIKGKGGSIAYLQQGDVEPSPTTLYLNHRTGDAYQSIPNTDPTATSSQSTTSSHSTSSHIWKPIVNVGLKVHVPPHPQSDIVSRSVSESLFKKSKNFLHHWAFVGIPDQFVAPTASHFWDVADIPTWHSLTTSPSSSLSSSSSSSSSFLSSSSSSPSSSSSASPPSISPSCRDPICSPLNILANIECGPAMLEYDSMIAVHFAVNELYPFTVKILQNYISAKLDLMMNFGNQEYPSHRMYKKLVAVGNFSKFEERPKPTLSRARSQPFPNPLLPLSSTSISPKIKIPLSPSPSISPSPYPSPSHTPPLLSSPSRISNNTNNTNNNNNNNTINNPPLRFSPSPIRRVTSVSPKIPHKKEEKEKIKDGKLTLPIVKVPPTLKSPPPPRLRPWHNPPDSMLYD